MRHLMLTVAVCGLAACQADTSANATANIANAPVNTPESPAITTNVTETNANTTETTAKPALNLAPDGVSLVDVRTGAARTVTFETSRALTLAALEPVLGKPLTGKENVECPVGPLFSASFANGLEVYFQDNNFVGWDVDPAKPGLATASGIAVGSTRTALESAYAIEVDPETSLGIQFMAGQLMGILTSTKPDGKIEALWAGATCIAS